MKNYDYYIWKDGTTYRAESNGTTTTTDYTSSTSLDHLLNTVVFPNFTNGLRMLFANQSMQQNNPITCPNSASAVSTNYVFQGMKSDVRNIGGTTFQTTTSFPTGRPFIESVSLPGSGKGSGLVVRDIQLWNVYPDLGVGSGTELDVAGIKYENDVSHRNLVYIENVYGSYLYRGIHLIGYIHGGTVKNVRMDHSGNANFRGDCDFILERTDRDQVGGTEHDSIPAAINMENLMSWHYAGGFSSSGHVQNVLYMNSKYCNVRNMFINSPKCEDSMIRLNKAWSNSLDNITSLDLNFAHANSQAVVILDNVDNSNLSQQTYGNKLTNMRLSGSGVYPYTLKFLNGALRNEIHAEYFGSNPTIDDVNAGIGNFVYIHEGHQPSNVSSTPITQTATNVVIVDLRKGAINYGSDTITQNTISKTVTHNLIGTPQRIRLIPTSNKFMDWYISAKSSTTFTVALTKPTLHDITFDWEATVNKA